MNIVYNHLYLLRPLNLQKSSWKKSCYQQKKEEEGGQKGDSFFLSLSVSCVRCQPASPLQYHMVVSFFPLEKYIYIYINKGQNIESGSQLGMNITFPSLPPFTFCRIYKISFGFLMMMMMREREKEELREERLATFSLNVPNFNQLYFNGKTIRTPTTTTKSKSLPTYYTLWVSFGPL